MDGFCIWLMFLAVANGIFAMNHAKNGNAYGSMISAFAWGFATFALIARLILVNS